MTMPKLDWTVNVISLINFFVIIGSALFSVSFLYFSVNMNSANIDELNDRVIALEQVGSSIEIRQLRESLAETRQDLKIVGDKVQALNDRLFSIVPRD